MRYGFCNANGYNQHVLDTCPAVLSYELFTNQYLGSQPESFVFSYDESIEVPYAPTLTFAQADSREEALSLARAKQ